MICPKCLAEIPDDSSFCDQCGIELMVCSLCGKFGLSEYCEVDNSKMIKKGAEQSEKKIIRNRHKSKKGSKSFLILNNKNLNIEIKIENDGVIGRKSEIGSEELKRFKQISSNHASIEFKTGVGWFITDLNTTNGTKVNDIPLKPSISVQINQGDSLTLANIEFFVSH